MAEKHRTTPGSARPVIRAEDATDLEEKVLTFTRTHDAWAALTGTAGVRFISDVLEHSPAGVLTRVGPLGYVLEITDPVAFTDEVRGRLAAVAQEHWDAADQAAEEPRPLSPFEVLKHALETGDFRPLALTPENTPELFGRTFVGGQRIGDDRQRPRRDRRN